MHTPSLLLTILPLLSLKTPTAAALPSLSLTDIRFYSYVLFVTPSAQGPRQGVIFTMTNSAIEVPITCSAVSYNAYALFSSSVTYECNFAPAGGEEEREDPWCWTNSATFNFDTTKLDEKNVTIYDLTVEMSWTCENEGVYGLSAQSILDLDCSVWSCENRMWPKYDIYSNTSTYCAPYNVSFGTGDVEVLKLE
ncbi:hypothetical protein BKA58DRAFT_448076 [Alternaria rosae]|uniref:uncharacterized protein n=1 Tax=Alternaria rosae TaxID=1187941 RepID=UPI001E8D69DA|nr:uncharacterized protein BKA58DRAFT_448076 [Alternaria rosae]KAH6883305.1 hypothetical protein BKA58DRAFT_448076 [Alternaria rosae]